MNEQKRAGVISLFLRRKNIVLLVATCVLLYGITCYMNLPKQQYPVIVTPAAVVTAVYPGAAAEDMEELVTEVIEDAMIETDGYDSCTSDTFNGVCIVMAYFDIDLSSEEVQECKDDLRFKVQALQNSGRLPAGVTQLTFNGDLGDTEGLFLAFTSDKRSNSELYQRVGELKEKLRDVDGVKRVSVFGKKTERIDITVDTDKLNTLALSMSELCSLIEHQNSMIPIGDIELAEDIITVNGSGRFESLTDIENIVVSVSPQTGAVVCLKDIADIQKVTDRDAKQYEYNGNESVLLSVSYETSINVIAVAKELFKEIEVYGANLPSDIQMTKVVDLSSDVSRSISEFTVSILQAILIVLVVVMLFMNLRNGGIIAVAIPVSIMAPFLVMKLFSIDIQFISLAALIIALGMLVANAIVVSDAIQVRLDNGEERFDACINGTREVAIPVLTSTLTTICIFIAFYFLPGTMYSFTSSLPTIIIAALTASYVVSVSVTPVMCYLLMKESRLQKQRNARLLNKAEGFTNRLLQTALTHEKQTILISVCLVVFAFMLLSQQQVDFMPKSDKTLLDVSVVTDNINDIRKTKEVAEKVVAYAKEQPEVQYYLSTVGGNLPRYDFCFLPDIDGINKANIVLGIDLEKGGRFKNNAALVDFMQTELENAVSGCDITVKELSIIPGSSAPIEAEITGDDFDMLNRVADDFAKEFAKLDGAGKISINKQFMTPQFYVDTDDTSLLTYGLTKAELLAELNAAIMGRDVSLYRKDSKEYNLRVNSNIHSTDELANLMIKSRTSGTKYPLKQIADITLKDQYDSISRYNGNRTVTLLAYPKTGHSAVQVQNQLQKVMEKHIPKDVSVQYGGDSDSMQTALRDLMKGTIAGLAGILMILYLQFNSWKKVSIVLLAIPFGIVGSSVGLFLFRPGFNMFTILGIISLFGVVINNSIVLVDYIDSQRSLGVSVTDACRSAVSRRFRPIVLSTVTTILGLIPLAIGKNLLFTGLAIAFMSGAILSMFFTLIVVPVVYHFWEGREQKQKD